MQRTASYRLYGILAPGDMVRPRRHGRPRPVHAPQPITIETADPLPDLDGAWVDWRASLAAHRPAA